MRAHEVHLTQEKVMNKFERNKEIESSMKNNSENRIRGMIDNVGDEHSLQFSMFVKDTFDAVRCYVGGKDTKPPFMVPLYQSSYIIAAMLIPCVLEPKPLRDLIRDKSYSLTTELGWNIDLSERFRMPRARKDTTLDEEHNNLYEKIVNCHNRMLNVVKSLVDTYEHLSSVDIGGFVDGVILDDVYLSKLGEIAYYNAQYLQSNDDEYLNEISTVIAEYRGVLSFVISDGCSYKVCVKSHKTNNELYAIRTAEEIIREMRIHDNFYTNRDMFEQSIKEEWFLKYMTEVIMCTGIVDVVSREAYDTAGSVVIGNDRTVAKIEQYVVDVSNLRPKAKPLIVQPKPWAVVIDDEGKQKLSGGFHTLDVPLIPASKPLHKFPESDYLKAVNKIQQTGFRINRSMYGAVSGMDYLDKVPKIKPKDSSKTKHNRNVHSIKSKNRDTTMIMELAKEYMTEEELYFILYADFRGRDYYRQEYLSPQGRDLSKALLEFNKGYKLTNSKAVKWMKINLANLGGQDGLTYAGRVKWVDKNTRAIRTMVNNPKMTSKLFVGADKPWQFLAACFDYVGWLDDKKNHKSHLPNGMDGKCNGTQHWCAMLRDKDGGAKVALLNSEVPSDLYNEVLEKLIGQIEVYTKKVDDGTNVKIKFANAWVDKSTYISTSKGVETTMYDYIINRKLTKTPTMTSTYSAGKKAFLSYVTNFCIDKGVEFDANPKENRKYIGFMVSEIITAIDNTVSAKAGMTFVQECITNKDEELHYRTQLGFHMYMSPKVEYKREFKVRVDGRIRRVTFNYKGDRINGRAMQTGIAPNFIHSNDATHMLKTVLVCDHITHWMMVHDQFGCHHTFVDDMQMGIRKSFVGMYNNNPQYGDVFDALDDFRKQMGAEHISLPEYGELNVPDVIDSDYFFS